MHHPFHIHGAGRFLVLARDGEVEPNLVWSDTVLVRTGETVDILLEVTNPGRWMAHCHIAEHHESGMMFSFDVAEAEARVVTAAGDRYDVVVVGGGQAGLALGYFLARDGRRFAILEAADAPAAAWRKRWDSLKLFTPVRYDSLPGLRVPRRARRLSRPRRGRRLPHALRGALQPARASSTARCSRSAPATTGLRGRAARPRVRRRPGGDRHGAVPDAAGPGHRRAARREPRPDAQHRLPRAGRRSRRARAGGGRREHGLPDRRGAGRVARGPSLRRLAPDAAAAAAARPGPVPLSRSGAASCA